MSSLSLKEQMLYARELIKKRQYHEARSILKGIDHPKAREWLLQIETMIGDSGSSIPSLIKSTKHKTMSSEQKTPIKSSFTQGKGDIDIVGFLIVLLSAIITAPIIGGVLFLSSKLLYLIFMSIIVMSLACGVVVFYTVEIGKVRNKSISFMLGIFIGILAYGSFRYLEYDEFLRNERNYIQQEITVSNNEANQMIDLFLEEETGSSGFIGFIKLQADEGMSIYSTRSYGRGGGGLNIGPLLTQIYWVIEVLIASFIPAFFAFGQAEAPYCTDEDRWMKLETTGIVRNDDKDRFIELVEANNYVEASNLILRLEKMTHPYIEIEIGKCNPKAPDAFLKITLVKGDGITDRDILKEERISARQYNALAGTYA